MNTGYQMIALILLDVAINFICLLVVMIASLIAFCKRCNKKRNIYKVEPPSALNGKPILKQKLPAKAISSLNEPLLSMTVPI